MIKRFLVGIAVIVFISISFLIMSMHTAKVKEVKTAKNELQQLVESLPEGKYTTKTYENVVEKRNDAIRVLENRFSNLSQIKKVKEEYSLSLQNLVEAKKGRYIIKFETNLIFNENVGNDWELSFFLGNAEIKYGDIIETPLENKIVIKVIIIENDTIPDIKEEKFSIAPQKSSTSLEIEVEENRGRYIGNKAKWEIICALEQKELS